MGSAGKTGTRTGSNGKYKALVSMLVCSLAFGGSGRGRFGGVFPLSKRSHQCFRYRQGCCLRQCRQPSAQRSAWITKASDHHNNRHPDGIRLERDSVEISTRGRTPDRAKGSLGRRRRPGRWRASNSRTIARTIRGFCYGDDALRLSQSHILAFPVTTLR